ncbi:ubiquitin thioesterase OTUB2-like isoform X3 [Heptranchias perlo]|uniref:ubiquitin thioesterase OTUB2-like isoform X3 n=1 Tax=Heptranchias perlo TaxID=212740 RepID=UPI0035597458
MYQSRATRRVSLQSTGWLVAPQEGGEMDGAFGSVCIVSDKSEILALGEEHPEDRIYQQKVQDISRKYAFFRRTLGDGNCFYRALSFAYLESLLGSSKGVQKLRKNLMRSRDELLSAGFAESSFENSFSTEVEPMAVESDHIHITALTQALNIPIQVEYMDKTDTEVNHHIFPEGSKPLVYLLYKPGHYDILYKANKTK